VIRHFTSISKNSNKNSKRFQGLSSKDVVILEAPPQSGLSSDATLGSMVKQSGGVIVPSEVNQPNTEIVTHMFKSYLTKELGITDGS